jgi:hypothetical protein
MAAIAVSEDAVRFESIASGSVAFRSLFSFT